MSKAQNTQKTTSPVIANKPVVSSIIVFGTDFAERTVVTGFDLAQEVRGGMRSVADATVNFADTLSKSGLEFARTVVTRIDDLANASLDQGKSTVLDVVSAARNTGNKASELAANAVSGAAVGLVGEKAA